MFLVLTSLFLLMFLGTSVKHVLRQDKAAFVRLVGVSILQSGVSSFLAPSLRSTSFIFADHFNLVFYSLSHS